jgi:hypothetical protein
LDARLSRARRLPQTLKLPCIQGCSPERVRAQGT